MKFLPSIYLMLLLIQHVKHLVPENLVQMENRDIKSTMENEDQYYLWVRDEGSPNLRIEKDRLVKQIITVKEIERVLIADFYALLTSLLRMEGKEKFTYRLSGQSCKIALFNNLLKEFVPGKRMRSAITESGIEDPYATSISDSSILKKYCLQGSIEYIRDLAGGAYKPEIVYKNPAHIYNVYAQTSDFDEEGNPKAEILLERKNNSVVPKILYKPENTKEIKLDIKDANGVLKRSYEYQIEETKVGSLDDIQEEMQKQTSLSEEELQEKVIIPLQDSQITLAPGSKEYRIVVLPARDAYGITIFPIIMKKMEDQSIKYGGIENDFKFVPYEDEKLQTFFDGKH